MATEFCSEQLTGMSQGIRIREKSDRSTGRLIKHENCVTMHMPFSVNEQGKKRQQTIYIYGSRTGSKLPVSSGFRSTFNLIPLATLTAATVKAKFQN